MNILTKVTFNGNVICVVPYKSHPEEKSKLLSKISLEKKDTIIGEEIFPVLKEKYGEKYFKQKIEIFENISMQRMVSTYPDLVLLAFFRQVVFLYLTDSKKFSYLKERFGTMNGVSFLMLKLEKKVSRYFSLKENISWSCDFIA